MAGCLFSAERNLVNDFFRLGKNIFSNFSISAYSKKLEQHNTKFVPASNYATDEEIYRLKEFLLQSKCLFVLTGAGISTESGIPDYRSEGVGLYARSSNRPVQYIDFIKKSYMRQRYWARNFVGWPKFSSCSPNLSHQILSDWENQGIIHWLVTQNVDALHYKAGSKRVTELHGSSHRIHCLGCEWKSTRWKMQEMIVELNPCWHAEEVEIAPDGDVQLSNDQIAGFQVPSCPNCGGILKPEIVFFGDNVARPLVNFVHDRLKESDAVCVIGSTLEVFSGYRFVHAAHHQGKPVAILNIGQTRADNLSSLQISARCGDVLNRINLLL